jgi:hypothetical protein
MVEIVDQGDGLSKEVWLGWEWKPKLWLRGRILTKSNIEKILVVRWRDCFEQGIKWDAPSSFGLRAWPLEASQCARPKAPILICYWLFWAYFFGLSTKFAHSIPQPLDLDGYSVKRPPLSLLFETYSNHPHLWVINERWIPTLVATSGFHWLNQLQKCPMMIGIVHW